MEIIEFEGRMYEIQRLDDGNVLLVMMTKKEAKEIKPSLSNYSLDELFDEITSRK